MGLQTMPIDTRMVKWDESPQIDSRMVKWDEEKYDPTEGMSGFDKFAAGAGKAIVDTGRGLGQMIGLVDRKDVEDSRKLDAALMKDSSAKWGNFAGNVATTLPIAFVPGANTVKGASLIGSMAGLAQPSTSTAQPAATQRTRKAIQRV